MFTHLMDYTYTRNRKEAFGFYLAYMFLIALMAMLCSVIAVQFFDVTSYDEGYMLGLEIGGIVSGIACAILVFTIFIKRKLYRNFFYILMTIISLIFAILGGALFGLVIPAFFTTVVLEDI